MIFSGSSDWGGVFHNPIIKHQVHKKKKGERHPHHLPDHIEIRGITELTDEEIEEHDDDPESDFEIDELVHLGDGSRGWLIQHGWVATEETYEFVVWANEEPTEAEAKRFIITYYS